MTNKLASLRGTARTPCGTGVARKLAVFGTTLLSKRRKLSSAGQKPSLMMVRVPIRLRVMAGRPFKISWSLLKMAIVSTCGSTSRYSTYPSKPIGEASPSAFTFQTTNRQSGCRAPAHIDELPDAIPHNETCRVRILRTPSGRRHGSYRQTHRRCT